MSNEKLNRSKPENLPKDYKQIELSMADACYYLTHFPHPLTGTFSLDSKEYEFCARGTYSNARTSGTVAVKAKREPSIVYQRFKNGSVFKFSCGQKDQGANQENQEDIVILNIVKEKAAEHANKHRLRQSVAILAREITIWALHLEKNPEMIDNKLLRKGIRLPFGWQNALHSDKFEDGYFALLNRSSSGLKQEHALDPQLRAGLSYALLVYDKKRELSYGYYLTVSEKNNQIVEVQKVSANDIVLDCDSRKPAEEQLDESDRVLMNKISMKMQGELMEKAEKSVKF